MYDSNIANLSSGLVLSVSEHALANMHAKGSYQNVPRFVLVGFTIIKHIGTDKRQDWIQTQSINDTAVALTATMQCIRQLSRKEQEGDAHVAPSCSHQATRSSSFEPVAWLTIDFSIGTVLFV